MRSSKNTTTTNSKEACGYQAAAITFFTQYCMFIQLKILEYLHFWSAIRHSHAVNPRYRSLIYIHRYWHGYNCRPGKVFFRLLGKVSRDGAKGTGCRWLITGGFFLKTSNCCSDIWRTLPVPWVRAFQPVTPRGWGRESRAVRYDQGRYCKSRFVGVPKKLGFVVDGWRTCNCAVFSGVNYIKNGN